MFITISYVNLFILLAVSICHLVLAIIYQDQCPASPSLSITLIISGIIGIILSIISLVIHHFDFYDGSNKWNLILTCILFIYLIGSRIATSIMVFRLASQPHNINQCASALYWSSSLLVIVSYSIIMITGCLIIYMIRLQRRHNRNRKRIFTTNNTVPLS